MDAEREAARGAIDKMSTLSRPFDKATSTIGQADNPIDLMDSVSSFLTFLERFNSIVDGIAEV